MADYERHRERMKIPLATHDCEFAYEGDPWSTVGTYDQKFDQEVMDDVVSENYHKRIANGEIINHPCSYGRTWLQADSGSVKATKKPAYPSYKDWEQQGATSQRYAATQGFYMDDKYPSLAEEGVLMSRAKLLAVANLDKTPYAFGEDTLEIRETLRFLKNPLQGILQGVRSFERRKNKLLTGSLKWEKRADALSNLWLEYQFAASPLYRSLCDALDAYVIGNCALPKRLSSRGFSQDSNEDSGTETAGIADFDWRFQVKRECHAGILYEVTNPIRDWRFTLGFRMKDLPTTFWQVVPLSFMLDRILDVSHFSQGVINMADPNVKILSGFARTKDWQDSEYRVVSSVSGHYNISHNSGAVYRGTFTYKRNPWGPTFRDTIPKPAWSGIVDSATKVLDLAGLCYRPLKRWYQTRR
jgi:hypothetical protein